MEGNWQSFSLEQLAEDGPNAMCTGPFGSAISSRYFESEGIPVIRGGNLSADVGMKMSDTGLVFVNSKKAQEFRRSVVRPGDLIFTCWGTINQVGLITDRLRYSEYIISNKQMKYTPDRNKVDPLFMYYLFSGPVKQAEILQNGIGAAVPGFNLGQLKQHVVTIPSLNEQKRISNYLGTLDDKIEINRQMNATLEAMAQALFKSWFVDFDPVIDNALAAGNPIPEELQTRADARAALGDKRKPLPEAIQKQFPGRFVFTEGMGWVPEGWDVEPLDEIIELIGGGTPKTSIDEYWGGEIPWFSVVDAPNPSDVFVLNTEKSITQEGLNKSSARLLPKGATIISARGTVGKCALVARPMATNQSCYGIRGVTGVADYFVYYTVLLRVADLQQRGHGSVFNTITRDTFRTIKTCVPSSRLSELYNDTVSPYLDRILSNISQVDSLARTRDALLPKLLSGELRIPDAEKLAAAEAV